MSDLFQRSTRALDAFLPASSRKRTIPITFARVGAERSELSALTSAERTFLKSSEFGFARGEIALLPDEKGDVARVVAGIGKAEKNALETLSGGDLFAVCALANRLPDGDYHIDAELTEPTLAATAWALSSYRFDAYRNEAPGKSARLRLDKLADRPTAEALAQSIFLGRDLINTPANDLGPEELEQAARALADTFDASCEVTIGDALLDKNFPLIHAVGRASTRPPRLIDFSWGEPDHPKVTLVGKGVVFDTGGLNIKPGNSMMLMKKDMGGAAATLATARLIMETGLPVRLRVLIPAVENAVAGNAFRPGDVLPSHAGITVEIGNTDAEGRLVLADALSLADGDEPDLVISLATLTGSARVALGPDLPAFYATSDDVAAAMEKSAHDVHDPFWRMPFWDGYEGTLKSPVADVCHISTGPFAGSITAALFLRRFVKHAATYAHLDMYGWTPSAKPGRPAGGEAQCARAIHAYLSERYGRGASR